MPKVYDLSALAPLLRQQKSHPRLVSTIERWAQRNSRRADLEHALQLLRYIEEVGLLARASSVGEDMGSDLQGSLLAYAIVLYSRSASDGDRGRRHTFNFSNILPAERLITHNAILKLRKTAIAHLDERGRQQWASDHALLVVHEDGAWEYGFTFSRTLVVEALCKDFLSLLEYVAPALGKLLEAENEQVHAALSAAVGADPALFAILTSQVFDQANFYGERAEEFAGAIRESGSHLVRNVGPIVKGQ